MQTMLVPYHDEEAARAALNVAVHLAKRRNGYVEGLLVLGEPAVSFVPGMIVPPDYLSAAADEWRRFADRARMEFVATTKSNGLPMQELETPGPGPTAGWREAQGDEAEIVGRHGRLFDLIVVGRPENPAAGRWRDIREAALFATGRPVLLAPVGAAPGFGDTVVVSWNGSTEAARTVALGMPFLQEARRVEVLTVEGYNFPGPDGAELAAHLARHGITASSRHLRVDDSRPPGEVVLDEAGDIGADLILKGAFTRSRFRQVVFGGITQHILDYAKTPVLLAH
jgi:nucleotide-binding universal stress UspA family protein